MAYDVVWSPQALEDAGEIGEYIARDSPQYASAVVDSLLEATRKLQNFPFAGRVVPELGDELIREKFVYSYRLIYRVEDKRVLILAIIHFKRLLPLEIG